MTDTPPLAGQVVVFAGVLARISRRDAASRVEHQQGRVAASVTRDTTLLIVGEDLTEETNSVERVERVPRVEHADARRLADAARLNLRYPGRVRLVSAEEFYTLAGVPGSGSAPGSAPTPAREHEGPTLYSSRTIRGLYPALRDDHLRYLERWGLVRPERNARGETLYGFADLAVIRQASAELARGLTFRSVLRALVAEHAGQLAFDFQPGTARTGPGPGADTPNAKVVRLTPRAAPRPDQQRPGTQSPADSHTLELAASYFAEGAELDAGDEPQQDAAMMAYRRALTLDPALVAALVNLANLHYARDAIVEAEALYEKALALDSACFEAHFNLGNVYHDTGRFEAAVHRYRQALGLDGGYADAHFYLAVTLEKLGRSGEARPHWTHYQRLAPNGEWVALAKEFGE
jgi:tetratricopeptide (TPR) repeat protein